MTCPDCRVSDTGCTPLCAESKKEPSLREGLKLFNDLCWGKPATKLTAHELEYLNNIDLCHTDGRCIDIDKAIELYNKIKGV